ncbi:uncharacterized protein LOC120781429 [Bactrocera tryoni]|uniref:uncharacterized protein LOC120781429 n=1 Tax=Bactrocera tryoni TaxID=59916 RepID=UPI001A95A166|nr:uncharacterized protein LOC120781429 [Bactrocera tryoni]
MKVKQKIIAVFLMLVVKCTSQKGQKRMKVITLQVIVILVDGTLWQSDPFQPQSGRFRNENVISLSPGVTRFAKARVNDIKDAFLLFLPPHLENIIPKHTNAFDKAKYGDEFMRIDSSLLQAYIGILILTGVYRSKNESTVDLFDAEYGRPIFRVIMSKKTFEYINQVIRFDDTISRRQKTCDDKFAPIRDVFEKWSNSLADYYNPHE